MEIRCREREITESICNIERTEEYKDIEQVNRERVKEQKHKMNSRGKSSQYD